MRLSEITEIVDGTSDAAFAVDGCGLVVGWNKAAAAALGLEGDQVIGEACSETIAGLDDDGVICSVDCAVRKQVDAKDPLRSFDLMINTPAGRTWFNVTLIVLNIQNSARPYTVHVLRSINVQKRLEALMRDFVLTETGIEPENVANLLSSRRTLARDTSLTAREIQILKLVASGGTSRKIGCELEISPTTVDNHLQHILKKLNTHSRLEAVLRAEHAGLL